MAMKELQDMLLLIVVFLVIGFGIMLGIRLAKRI